MRKLYTKVFGVHLPSALQQEESPDKASELIYNLLASDKPCMIARFGANELGAVVNYLGVNSSHHSIKKFIKREQAEWWWDKDILNNMQNNAGFFPATAENIQRFGELIINDAKEVDLLGSWLTLESFLSPYMHSINTTLQNLEPFWVQLPWTRILKNKRILVIHPFAETIEQQYLKKDLLFKNEKILPTFELTTIKAVQSIGGTSQFKDWFEALNWMKQEINKKEYDICLIGCGAYGFPLAAHVKRQGKKAVHLGGVLQLLFGIRGNRWENPNYGVREWGIPYGSYSSLMNKYWIRPREEDRPQNADKIEGACYW